MSSPSRDSDLRRVVDTARAELASVHEAREIALRACRATIQAASRTIRAIHRGEGGEAVMLAADAEAALAEAHDAVAGRAALAGAGFVHDAEKEFAEARLFAVLVDGAQLPPPASLGVAAPAWFNGLAEAASELRRHILDRLRAGELDRAEVLLSAMDDVYGVLVTVDYPDAVTGGLRRSTDALRAVLERTRSDLTTTMLQARLQSTIADRLPPDRGR